MKKLNVIIALILAFTLSTTALATTYDTIESTHGTHANPGKTTYIYSENGKAITEVKAEVINVCPMTKFTDLKVVDWSHEGIDFVLSNGYMVGTSDTKFEPNGSMTRGMVVTVLFRIAEDIGADSSRANSVPFTDVKNGTWYTEAIKWAYKHDIAKGMSSKSFAPDDSVTREQITLFICRFAKFIGDDVSKSGDISKFNDVSNLSSESKTAVSWAVGKGILKGLGNGKIGPKETATRAQFAAMLQRWLDGRCTEHKYVLVNSVDASCGKDGGKLYACSICRAEKYVRVPATEHSYGEKKVTKPASCTEAGSYEQVCKNCGDKISGEIPATGHDYGDKTVTKNPSCTEDGISEQSCKICKHKITESIPHIEHSYGVKEVSKAPTCTEAGTYEQICANCGAKITGEIPALGHDYGEKQIGKAASCTEAGNWVKVCKNCDNAVVLDTIPATGHSYTEKVIKEPSCTETGTRQKNCSACGDTLTEAIPMTAHKYTDGVCTVCGKFEHSAIKTSSLSDGDKVIICNTAAKLSLGSTEKGIALNAVPTKIGSNEISVENGAAILTVEKSKDGVYLKNADGKYLSCAITEDGGKLCFSDKKSDDSLWKVSDNFIVNANAKLDGEEQYIACRKNVFECIELTDNVAIFSLEFYKVP